jgi:L-2,4-diaminobutyrate decarboxylase
MMLVPGLVTAVVFRDGSRAYQAFAQEASYLFDDAADEPWFDVGLRTLECTKRMMSLELYTAVAIAGTRFLDNYVSGTFDLARRFAEMIGAAPDLEIAVSPACNIVCFRHVPEGLDGVALDDLQARIRRRIVEDGGFYLVQTRLPRGVFLRVTLINPLTTAADLEALLYRVREASEALRAI